MVVKMLSLLIFLTVSDPYLNCAAEAGVTVFFEPGHYAVMENVGTFQLTVTRKDGDLSETCMLITSLKMEPPR